MKKQLKELTTAELLTILKNNKQINDDIRNEQDDNTMFWIEEYLNVFSGSIDRCNIGFCNHNYIRIANHRKFIECFNDFVETFSARDEIIKKVNDAMKLLKDCDDDEIIENEAESLKIDLLNIINSELDYYYSDEELLDQFLLSIENGYFDNYYVINDDLSVVYEEVIKSYK